MYIYRSVNPLWVGFWEDTKKNYELEDTKKDTKIGWFKHFDQQHFSIRINFKNYIRCLSFAMTRRGQAKTPGSK